MREFIDSEVLSASSQETELQARTFAAFLANTDANAFIEMQGELGAGKTTFVRALIETYLKLHQENPPNEIPSPTFNLVKQYGKKIKISHLDLYRIETLDELEQIDYKLYFYESDLCIVEWFTQIPEKEKLAPKENYFLVKIEFTKEDKRKINIIKKA